VLTPSLVKVDPVVQRGEHVTAVATGGGVSIQVGAVALAAGAAGQRIRLKNLSSGKEIEGVVRGPGRVEIRVP
jgi:flagella basal body P-ring formation protein FlgA